MDNSPKLDAVSSVDHREVFAQQLKEQMNTLMGRLQESIQKDKVMGKFDDIAVEAIRLNLEGWDQMTMATLRENIRLARIQEREQISRSMQMKVQP